MYAKFFKRLIDVFLCTLALIVLSPVYVITAIAIKVSSKGPVFYVSKRAGIGGKPFSFYKFRSMHVTNNDKGLCVADAERVFHVGKIIRKLKIDELPQLLNVIKGDMSIVGPRPMVAGSVHEFYSGKYEDVLLVRPGLTSAASLFDYVVGDRYSDEEAYRREIIPVKLELELLYVHKQSFRYDAKLVFRTVLTIACTAFGKQDSVRIPECDEIQLREGQEVHAN